MPSKSCPVCGSITQVSSKDWPLVSQMPVLICSRKCAWDFIETCPSQDGYLAEALTLGLPAPTESYSELLGRFFRSEYERFVAEAFSESGIPFEYEKYAFPVKSGAFWTPDFHLPVQRIFVEVKGPWGTSAKGKVLSFFKKHPEVSLLLLPWTIHDEFYPVKEAV